MYEGISQVEKSYKFYKMTLGKRYVTGNEHMIFKVVASGFQSDPDIYISKANQYPTMSANSEWHCEKEGTDTCVVHKGEFNQGETFYFGVKCLRDCKYDLRVWLTNVTDLSESSRTQMRFDAMSTQIFKYYIPNDVNG